MPSRLPLLVLVAMVAAAACGLVSPDYPRLASDKGVNPASLVVRGNVAYGTRLVGDELQVVALDPKGTETVVATHRPALPDKAVTIAVGMASADVEPCCVFAFGTAGNDVKHVEVDSATPGSGGLVSRGTWLVVIAESDADPAALQWRFVGADGSVLLSGEGPYRP